MTHPIPMPFSGKDVPHVVIEVNQTCDMSCTACYKNKGSYTKPMQLVKEEIDLAVGQRKLDMLTLAGGEPTLHPRLPEIISYAQSKGVKVSMLSNGLHLTHQGLETYARAGLGRVVLHVDSMQRRPDSPADASERDLNPLRERILKRVVDHGMRGGLALTLYRDNLAQLPDVLDFVLSSPWVNLLLVTCCKSLEPIARQHGSGTLARHFEDGGLAGQEVTTAQVAKAIWQYLGLEPAHYIGSNLRTSELRWLFYLMFSIMDGKGGYHLLNLSGRYRRTITAANSLQKLLKGHYKFDMVPGPAESVAVCLAYGLSGMDPNNLAQTLRFLARLKEAGTSIQSKVLVFQQLPNLTRHGGIEYCENCPDATVRNGRILPLCLADILSPLE